MLRPDEQGRTAVRMLWDALRDAGLPSIAGHRKGAYPPHLSLTVADDLPVEIVETVSSGTVLPSETLAFEALGCFPNGVLHLTAVPDRRLLKAHANAYKACGGAVLWQHYAPGTWTPHVTLGYGYSPRQVGQAAELLLPLLPLRLTGWTAWLEDAGTGEDWPIT